MAQLIPGPTSRWNLDEEETLRGSIIGQEQKMYLQNQLADISEQLLSLKYDPLNPHQFGLEQAHLQGQLDFGRFLLDTSEVSEKQLSQLIQSRSFEQ